MRNPITSLIKTAYKHAKGHRLTVLLYLALISTGASLWLLEPYIFGKLFNVLQVGGEPEEVLREVAFYLGAFASLSVLFWVFHGTGRVLERKTAFYITAKYQEEALESLFGRSIEWHRNNHSGKNIDKIRRGRDALYNFTQDTFELIEIFIAVFGSFVALFLIEPYVAAVAFFFSVVAILEVILFDRILFKQYKKLNSHYNKVSSAIHDYVTNIFTVLTMRFGNSAVKEYRKRQFAALPVFKKNIILNEVKWACMTFIITAMIFGVLGIEIYRMVMAEGVVMVGSLYMLYGYLDRISSKFYDFAWKYSKTVEQDAALASAEGLFMADGGLQMANGKLRMVDGKWSEIRVQGLCFTYTDEKQKKHQIKDVSLNIPRGARIAFVGESGCGKSTVLGLLRGIYATDKAKVLVDGKGVAGGLSYLHEMTTLMPQEPEIFENTIKYNITMGVSVPRKEIDRAIEIARFGKVVSRLPDGLNTDIAEKGVNLSGGENQRLALARGLVAGRGSDILLMDEPTSSVDMANEKAIFERIFAEYPDKTIIASVHRLNLLPMFDYVVEFQGGRVVG